MERVSSSVVTAALLVGLMILPAASENLSQDETVTSFESPNNSAKSTKVSRTSDSFVKEVSTAFDDFKINVSGDQSTAVLEEQGSQIKTTRKPGKTVKELKTSKGVYKKTESYDKEVIKVSTPRGTLVEELQNGKRTVKFEGVNRTRVEDVKASLEQKFNRKQEELNERNSYTEQSDNLETEPSVDLDVQPDTSEGNGEYVELTNNESKSLDISGWRIEDESGTSYSFENATLPGEDGIRLYTDYNDAEYNWDRGLAVWSQSGDTAYLYDSQENLIAEQSY